MSNDINNDVESNRTTIKVKKSLVNELKDEELKTNEWIDVVFLHDKLTFIYDFFKKNYKK